MEQERKSGLSRRAGIRIISYCAAAALALGGAAISGYHTTGLYRTQLEYTYQRGLEDLSSTLHNIDIALEKGIYCASAAQLSSLSAQLWKEAGTAKSALAQLPESSEELTTINKFLSQVGDYAMSLSKKTIEGGRVSDQERDNLMSLSDTAGSLSARVDDLRALYEDGALWAGEIQAALANDDLLSGASDIGDGFGASLLEAEESLTDYPTLLYDGPFSDHILNKTPTMTENAAEVSREDARKKAAELLGVPASVVTDGPDEDGTMPSYGFAYEDAVVSVTKNGGYGVYMRNPRNIGTEVLSYEEAVNKAREWLESHGFTGFKESYYMADEGTCVVNFAYTQDGVVCYPDLMKVGVALDNGEVVFYEARGYLMNHKDRELSAPVKSEEEARAALSPVLTVESSALCVIPTDGGGEKYCYEFRCKGLNEEEVLVYINTETLSEDQIFVLLRLDGGVMVK